MTICHHCLGVVIYDIYVIKSQRYVIDKSQVYGFCFNQIFEGKTNQKLDVIDVSRVYWSYMNIYVWLSGNFDISTRDFCMPLIYEFNKTVCPENHESDQ